MWIWVGQDGGEHDEDRTFPKPSDLISRRERCTQSLCFLLCGAPILLLVYSLPSSFCVVGGGGEKPPPKLLN